MGCLKGNRQEEFRRARGEPILRVTSASNGARTATSAALGCAPDPGGDDGSAPVAADVAVHAPGPPTTCGSTARNRDFSNARQAGEGSAVLVT